MNKLVSRSINILLVTAVMCGVAQAACNTKFSLDPSEDVCWECMLPIRIAGAEYQAQSTSGMPPNPPGLDNASSCYCPAPPPVWYRYGVPVSYFEPTTIMEVVRDKYCFPTAGEDKAEKKDFNKDGAKTEVSDDTHNLTVKHLHIFKFNFINMLGMMMDYACMSSGGIDAVYLSEVDAAWFDDNLAAKRYKETALFANPIFTFSCVADAVAANAYLGLPFLPYCMGSQGIAFPLSGSTPVLPEIKATTAVVEKGIFLLTRAFGQCTRSITLCACIPIGVINKWDYRYHIAVPFADSVCHNYGRSQFWWQAGKLSQGITDNTSFVVFEKRQCCVF